MAGVLKQLGVVALLGAAAFGGWKYYETLGAAEEAARRARGAPGVVVEAVVRDRVERAVSAVGAAKALRSVALAPSASGRIAEILVAGGETVESGQVLLRLEDEAERARLAEAEAEQARARNAFQRADALRAEGRVAETAWDEAQATLAAAEAAVRLAEKALADRTLRAPFAGLVGFRAVDEGAIVGPSDAIATLDDISALDVDFAAPERFFGEVALGAEVRATTEIYPGETFTGVVDGVDRRIDQVSRSFTVRARIPNKGMRLPAGAFMRVTLVLDAREGVIAPEEAVVTEGGGAYVYVVAEERAERRPVTLGQRFAGRVEIREGLEAGETVITRGVQKARDGAPVRIMEVGGAAPAPGA